MDEDERAQRVRDELRVRELRKEELRQFEGLAPDERAWLIAEELALIAARTEARELEAERVRESNRGILTEYARYEDSLKVRRPGGGRPGWSRELFDLRWRRAIRQGKLPEDATARDVLDNFRGLQDEVPELATLERLVRRFRAGKMPSAAKLPPERRRN